MTPTTVAIRRRPYDCLLESAMLAGTSDLPFAIYVENRFSISPLIRYVIRDF